MLTCLFKNYSDSLFLSMSNSNFLAGVSKRFTLKINYHLCFIYEKIEALWDNLTRVIQLVEELGFQPRQPSSKVLLSSIILHCPCSEFGMWMLTCNCLYRSLDIPPSTLFFETVYFLCMFTLSLYIADT